MNPRDAINFIRSRTGALLVFLMLLAIAVIVAIRLKPSQPIAASAKSTPPDAKPQLVERVSRAMSAFKPPTEKAAATPSASPAPKAALANKPPELPPISLYATAPTAASTETLSQNYAPFGRLIPCELVITVDSSALETPIVGLVTDDVWHDGRLIIPAGTEVHGIARVDRMRERIASSGGWTFVWQTGEELNVSGLALDREKQADADGWGITDGSAGLRGRLIKSDDLAEIKLFAATFLSGAASALTEKQSTPFGSVAIPSLQNAPLAGAQEVLSAYAKQILETIQRDGFYVRVPAGKQFYLYATQTIDRTKAVLGGSRLTAKAREQEDANDPLSRLRQTLHRISSPSLVPTPSAQPQTNPASIR